jgi:hypothetical protein
MIKVKLLKDSEYGKKDSVVTVENNTAHSLLENSKAILYMDKMMKTDSRGSSDEIEPIRKRYRTKQVK